MNFKKFKETIQYKLSINYAYIFVLILFIVFIYLDFYYQIDIAPKLADKKFQGTFHSPFKFIIWLYQFLLLFYNNYIVKSFTVISSIVVAVFRFYKESIPVKIYGCNYNRYGYLMNLKNGMILTICLGLFLIVFKLYLTMLYYTVVMIFYSVRLFFINDYTDRIKKYMKEMFFNQMNSLKENNFDFDNSIEKMIIYNEGSLIEKKEAVDFNIELLHDLYDYDDNSNQRLRILSFNIYKSINAFFISEETNIQVFDYYIKELYLTLFKSKVQKDFDSFLLILIFSILEIDQINETLKEKYIQYFYNSFRLNYKDEDIYIVGLEIYIIIFWMVCSNRDFKYIELCKCFYLNKKTFENYSNDELMIALQSCKNVLSTVFSCNDIQIARFQLNYLIYIHYLGNDLVYQYLQFIQEVGDYVC